MAMETADPRPWRYPAGRVHQDRMNHPSEVKEGVFTRLTGVDGRFEGGARRFPGFFQTLDLSQIDVVEEDDAGRIPSQTEFEPRGAFSCSANLSGGVARGWMNRSFQYGTGGGSSHHINGMAVGSIRFPAAWPVSGGVCPIVPPSGTSEQTINEVWFFKYVSVIAGNFALRGFVVAHPYRVGSDRKWCLRFVYWTTPGGMEWQSLVLLREVSTGADGLNGLTTVKSPGLMAVAEIDAAAMGPFLYFCVDGNGLHIKRSVKFESAVPSEAIFTDFGPPPTPAPAGQFEFGGNLAAPLTAHLRRKVKALGRMFSRDKNVEGPSFVIADDGINNAGGKTGPDYDTNNGSGVPQRIVANSDHLSGTPGGLQPPGTGFHQYDELVTKIRVYRSLDSAQFEIDGVTDAFELASGTIFKEKEVTIEDRQAAYSTPTQSTPDYAFWNPPLSGSGSGVNKGPYLVNIGTSNDFVIASQKRLDPLKDEVGTAPLRMTRLLPHRGTLLRVGSFPTPGPLITEEFEDRPNILSWGRVKGGYAPEECRVENSTPLGTEQDEIIHSLVGAGAYAFAVGDTSVYRIVRNGPLLNITEVETLVGGVGRWGAAGVGSSMAFVNPTGLYLVDGPTGEFQLVRALERVILEEWARTLPSIRIAYDNRLGAIILVNTSERKAVILWSNSGSTGYLEGVPFKWGTQGVDPETAGFNRSFWITKYGKIYTPNADRDPDEALTMMGGPLTQTLSGITLQTRYNFQIKGRGVGTGGRTFISQNPTVGVAPLEFFMPPCNILGDFEVTFLSGNYAGQSFPLRDVGLDGVYIELDATLDPLPDVDSIVAIGPITMEIVGWPLQREEGVNKFNRKIIHSMGANLVIVGGEMDAASPWRLLETRVYRRGSLSVPVWSATKRLSEDPSRNSRAIGGNGPLLYPSWRNQTSNLDLDFLEGIVDGTDSESRSESDPAAQNTGD